jgi:CubicO group peptidase (beta-lactamase class C family)
VLTSSQVNVDWAGVILERATGMSLNDYIQEKICKPLGLEKLNFFPTEDMKKNLAHMHQRAPDGTLMDRDHVYQAQVNAQTDDQKKAMLNSGGGGLFAKPQEFCRMYSLPLFALHVVF